MITGKVALPVLPCDNVHETKVIDVLFSSRMQSYSVPGHAAAVKHPLELRKLAIRAEKTTIQHLQRPLLKQDDVPLSNVVP